ncbi:hypothetical protein B0H17DRAFT_1181586 [Mycena rosella]|uniref:Uncharacterized protein n=1 Tax=Mycena rosella TaxID=1033263 RepID=A0AAD7D7X6_MYCRO|nr:hypothetical protein B0H17DRAFT_1181586 [Mycena rosella]
MLRPTTRNLRRVFNQFQGYNYSPISRLARTNGRTSAQPGFSEESEGPPNNDKQALARLEEFNEQIHVLRAAEGAEPHYYLLASHTIISEVTSYLARHGDGSEAYLSIFMNSNAPRGSDLLRARRCVFNLTETAVAFISLVPRSSPLRAEHTAIFDLNGALEPLYMLYNEDIDTRQWREFWNRAQPVILELWAELHKAGFGPEEE